jgi:hypothetical protein
VEKSGPDRVYYLLWGDSEWWGAGDRHAPMMSGLPSGC